ncbi:hypothetical protein TD95_004759 [Thielaviopsis punctulata]|uniref:CID domain-containing protein n=1 Tax=Thielaviopsis punctulata TaxID=72032 RepID=A0A0F4ZEV7_9PEZI|nr:hypothetical protein TD95_004759 [Thielaviopsis punctulata]
MSSNNNFSKNRPRDDKDKDKDKRGLFNFPDAEAKLAKLATKSVFDKQKADAHAKRQREAAETAAVYQDFIKSLDADEHPPAPRPKGFEPAPPGPAVARFERDHEENIHRTDAPKGFKTVGGTGGFRRHFGAAQTAVKSGSASSGAGSGISFSGTKKPTLGGFVAGAPARKGGSTRAALGFEDDDDDERSQAPPTAAASITPAPAPPAKSITKVFNTSDDEDDSAAKARDEPPVSRPTIRLAQLPPDTSPVFVKSLIPSSLTVENIQILPSVPAGSSTTERRSAVAIVTLAQDSPAADIDVVVSQLQNKYLGFGYYLSLHRHVSLSSTSSLATGAAAELRGSGATSLVSAGASTQPFGARQVGQNPKSQGHIYRGGQHNFVPPPSTYGVGSSTSTGVIRHNLFYVPVKPPADIRVVRTINKVLEQVLQHGPEFEALLMSRPDVQRDERWAWIWDARSDGGVWYRWKLWEIATAYSQKQQPSRSNKDQFVPLFDGSHAWRVPKASVLPFEYTTQVDEFVSDPEYASDSDSDDGGSADKEKEQTFLNPLEKARLTYLLAGLPTSTARLRKGHVARITAFAMTHASKGAAEVVDMVVANVHRPYALTGAARKYRALHADLGHSDGEDEARDGDKDADISSACLVGLYVVSDILSASSSSSVRHAWRFRQLFETALRESGVFGMLGGMAERNAWGRLRADRWKRSVEAVLGLWEGWCVFQAETQEGFAAAFERATAEAKEKEKREEEEREREREREKEGRWKSIEALPVSTQGEPMDADVATKEGEDVVGEPIVDSDSGCTDIEGEPFSESDDDEEEAGEPMDEDEGGEDAAGEPMESESE